MINNTRFSDKSGKLLSKRGRTEGPQGHSQKIDYPELPQKKEMKRVEKQELKQEMTPMQHYQQYPQQQMPYYQPMQMQQPGEMLGQIAEL